VSSSFISTIIKTKANTLPFASFFGFGEIIMVTTFSMILSLGFNVYFFPIYHIMSGLRAIFFLKNLKAGLCLIIGGSILEAVAYYGFYSAETIPWLQQSAGLLWLLGGIPCYIGIYLINKKMNKVDLVTFIILTICFVLGLSAVIN